MLALVAWAQAFTPFLMSMPWIEKENSFSANNLSHSLPRWWKKWTFFVSSSTKWTLRNAIAICLVFFLFHENKETFSSVWRYDFLSFINRHYVSFKWSLFFGVPPIPHQARMNIIHLWSWNVSFYFVPFRLLIVSFSLRFVLTIFTLCLCTKATFVLLKWISFSLVNRRV